MTTCERCGKRLGGPDHIHTCTPKTNWPTWPFKRLSPQEIEALLQKTKQQRIDSVGGAPL